LSLSDLGGGGTYDPVDEEIDLYVHGASESDALANLDTLNTLLDQAERFWRLNQAVNPVKLQFSPNGSALGVLQCLVRGRAKGDESAGLSLDVSALRDVRGFQIKVRVRLARNGLLLANSENATSASATIGDLLTTTLPSAAAHMSPMDVRFIGLGQHDDSPMVLPDMYFLFAPDSGSLFIQEAEAMTVAGYTSVADGNSCRGAAVLRYTPTGTTLVRSAISSAFTMTGKVLAFFAMVRNNSATTSFDVNVMVPTAGGNLRTTPVTIDTLQTTPRAVSLGVVLMPQAALSAGFHLEIAASAASGTLDIDVVYIVCLDDESSGVVQIPAQTIGTGTAATFFTNMDIDIESNVLTATQPTVKLRESGAQTPSGAIPYDYDPFLMSKGTTVCCVILAPGGPGASARWRYFNGGAVEAVTMKVTRYPAYPCPR
jgi:hypothetical protein